MNISTYIFGSLGNGYSQYPNDYSQTVLQSFYAQSSAPTQIAVHREDKLIFYGYIRKLDARQYIGLCVVLNSVMLLDFKKMFSIFENTITSMVVNGTIIQFNDKGDIVSQIDRLYTNQTEVARITEYLRNEFTKLEGTDRPLPPVSYGIAKNENRMFSIGDNVNDIIKASTSYNYTFIYKQEDFDTQSLNSYRGVVKRVCKERDELKSKCVNLSSQLTKAKAQQRNIKWVSFFGAIIIILGVVVWDKVLFPSEVTHYETGEFVYYGPLKNKKPHGVGVAIYPKDDADGRKYYIGNFVDGERQDTAAILFYQDGDYYYGSMQGDKWENGILYMNSDNSHFDGSFKNNEPYNGKWYDHKVLYILEDGQKVYDKKIRR